MDEYTAWHHTNTRPHAAKVFILEVHTTFFIGLTGLAAVLSRYSVALPTSGTGPDPDQIAGGPGGSGWRSGSAGRHSGQTGIHVSAQAAIPVW